MPNNLVVPDIQVLVDGDGRPTAYFSQWLNEVAGQSRSTGGWANRTIDSGAISVGSNAFYRVDTEGGAGLDTLTTINGGTDGQVIYLRSVVSTRDVRITSADNVELPSNITLEADGVAAFVYEQSADRWWQVTYG